MSQPLTGKPLRVRAMIEHRPSNRFPVIAGLDPAIQYPRTYQIIEVSDYWMPASAGMTLIRV
jgi:hypothetical protein